MQSRPGLNEAACLRRSGGHSGSGERMIETAFVGGVHRWWRTSPWGPWIHRRSPTSMTVLAGAVDTVDCRVPCSTSKTWTPLGAAEVSHWLSVENSTSCIPSSAAGISPPPRSLAIRCHPISPSVSCRFGPRKAKWVPSSEKTRSPPSCFKSKSRRPSVRLWNCVVPSWRTWPTSNHPDETPWS